MDGQAARQAVVSDLVNVSLDSASRASRNARRAACAVALVVGLALAGCRQSNTTDTASGTAQGGSSASPGSGGSASPGAGNPGTGSGGTGTGSGSGTGTGGGSGGGTGTGGAPKPGAPPECNDIAAAPALHEIGDTLDKMDTPDTAAAAKATLHADAGQLTTIAAKTSDGTLRSRLNAFAVAINNVADSGTDNMGTMMSFATTLRDVSQSAQDVCGLSIG
jgi:hypothetical protein